VCLWFLTKNKVGRPNAQATRDRRGETLFIDARHLGHMETRTLRAFHEEDVLRIADTYHSWRGTETSKPMTYADVQGFCRAVTSADIAEHGYVLTPARYVGSEATMVTQAEPLDDRIARLSAGIRNGFDKRAQLQGRVLSALESLERR